MTNWSELNHAYGSADDLPAILDALSPDPNAPSWGELCSRVCHQGTVYSASAPVLPRLLALVRAYTGADRVSPLQLAGAIANSQDRSKGFDLEPYRGDIEELASLARETLARRDLSRIDFIYLLHAMLALEGDSLWGDPQFGVGFGLADGEFGGECPHCDTGLQIVIGEHGFFVTDEEWVNRAQTPRNAVVPAEAISLRGVGARLHRLAHEANQAQVADWLRHVFGHANCPACEKPFAVEEAIARTAA